MGSKPRLGFLELHGTQPPVWQPGQEHLGRLEGEAGEGMREDSSTERKAGREDCGHICRGLLLQKRKDSSSSEIAVNKEMILRTEKNIHLRQLRFFLRKGRDQVTCYKNLQEMRQKETQSALKTRRRVQHQLV